MPFVSACKLSQSSRSERLSAPSIRLVMTLMPLISVALVRISPRFANTNFDCKLASSLRSALLSSSAASTLATMCALSVLSVAASS